MCTQPLGIVCDDRNGSSATEPDTPATHFTIPATVAPSSSQQVLSATATFAMSPTTAAPQPVCCPPIFHPLLPPQLQCCPPVVFCLPTTSSLSVLPRASASSFIDVGMPPFLLTMKKSQSTYLVVSQAIQ